MRYLDLFYNHFKPTGFNILTVNTDSPKSMSKVKPYVRTKGFEFHVAVDPNSQLKKKAKGSTNANNNSYRSGWDHSIQTQRLCSW